MSELSHCLNVLSLSDQLNFYHLKKLLDKAEVRVTSWGRREVTVEGREGSVSLDSIAKKIFKASQVHSHADDLLPFSQIAGVEMVRKLKHLYTISDQQLQGAHAITKFLNKIWEFSFKLYPTRFHIDEGTAENYFLGHSKYKFLARFGGTSDRLSEHPAKQGSIIGPPFRIIPKEDRLRDLLPMS